MTARRLASVRVKPAEHRAFARLSGDANPIHVHAAYARRTVAGEPVVHGIHLMLRALDAQFASGKGHVSPLTISARFLRPAFPQESITVFRSKDDDSTVLTLDSGGTLAEIVLSPRSAAATSAPGGRPIDGATRAVPRLRRTPAVHDIADVERLEGAMATADPIAARRAFPRASRALGSHIVAALTRLSAIVGMECPGRDSLLSQITLEVTPGARPSAIDWRVTRADRLLRLVRIAVNGEGVSGTVLAFVRRPPVPPPDLIAIASRVTPGEFAGQRALIIGGSRGLGATVAVIVAAGGGVPMLTYRTGAAEAAALKRAIVAAGHTAETLRFDATSKTDALERAASQFGATHLYYFATPKIFARRHEPFDAALFRRFSSVYVDAFVHACAAVARRAPALRVFYPSSTAIDEHMPDLMEYAAAKAAGEVICDSLQAAMPGVAILRRRLSRIATDQTATLIAAPAADPVDVMLPIVRELHQRKTGKT